VAESVQPSWCFPRREEWRWKFSGWGERKHASADDWNPELFRDRKACEGRETCADQGIAARGDSERFVHPSRNVVVPNACENLRSGIQAHLARHDGGDTRLQSAADIARQCRMGHIECISAAQCTLGR
jgi:hypothetical protein